MNKLEEAARRIDRAITDQGVSPQYHRQQMARLQNDWPTLWKAIDDLRRELR